MRRFTLTLIVLASAFVLAACHGGEHHELVVNTGADAPDAAPGDGVCESTAGAGDCTLRAAVDEANALHAAYEPATATQALDRLPVGAALADAVASAPPEIEIVLATDVALSIDGDLEDANATGDLDLRGDVSIVGDDHTIDGAGIDRVLEIHTGAVRIDRVRITGGHAAGPPPVASFRSDSVEGGAIRAKAPTDLTVVSSTFHDNRVSGMSWCQSVPNIGCEGSSVNGGAIGTNGTLTVVGSTFSSNRAISTAFGCFQAPFGTFCTRSHAGAINASGSVTIVASTFTGNVAGRGGAAFIAAPVAPVIRSSTFVDNTPLHQGVVFLDSTSDPFNPVGGYDVGTGSIFVYSACPGVELDAADHNLVSSSTCTTAPTAGLGPLQADGGATPTHLPAADSLAVDAIPFGTPGLCDAGTPVDQRGRARPVGGGCDIGAVERQADDP